MSLHPVSAHTTPSIHMAASGTPAPSFLSRLLVGAAIAAAFGAAPAQQLAAADAPPREAVYRVVNLGPGELSELPAINARGQVSFSLQTNPGSRGYFYDGHAVRDLGTLGGASTNAVGLNEAGQVTGYSDVGGGVHAFVWSEGAGMVDLGTLPDAYESAGAAINNEGVVAGYSHGIPFTPPHAFRWSATDGMRDLGSLSAGAGGFGGVSAAYALNDAGLIAGNSDLDAGGAHAFAWAPDRGMLDIDTLRSTYSLPAAVGAAGQVAGYFAVRGTDNLNHAFLWTAANGMRDLGTAGGVESYVIAMSGGAHIAGVVNLDSGDQHAMSWTEAGGMVDLGTLDGAPPRAASRALDVNNKGQIVGWSRSAGGDYQPFLWQAARGMVELNTRLRNAPAGLVIDEALAIADNGAIVAGSNAGLVLLKPCCADKGSFALGPVAAPDLVEVGAEVQASVAFADMQASGMRGASWSWGDGGAAQPGSVRQAEGAGSASASHRYGAPGIYALRATLVDRAGRGVTVERQVVVYAPTGGISGGSGAILSPQGALRAAPLKSGKAGFRFVAPAAGANGALRFNLAGWSFRGDDMRPAAGGAGRFEGGGAVNGRGGYSFALETAAGAAERPGVKGEQGRFGLKIWHVDPASHAEVVDYDNRVARRGGVAGAMLDGRILRR